jgi:hypothetical protein
VFSYHNLQSLSCRCALVQRQGDILVILPSSKLSVINLVVSHPAHVYSKCTCLGSALVRSMLLHVRRLQINEEVNDSVTTPYSLRTSASLSVGECTYNSSRGSLQNPSTQPAEHHLRYCSSMCAACTQQRKDQYVLNVCSLISGITKSTTVLFGAVLTHFDPSPQTTHQTPSKLRLRPLKYP